MNQDWCISRQRFFGVPFPVWYPLNEKGEADYEKPLLAEVSELPVDPSLTAPKGYTESKRHQPGGFVSDKDVMDTWASSSLTPQINSHWVDDSKRHQQFFPADLRPQAHENHSDLGFLHDFKILLSS